MAVTTEVKAEYVKEIGIVTGLQALPPNFTKVDGNLNDGNWGTATYLAYKLTEDPADAITGVEVFAGSSPSFGIQSGFTKIPKDLNKGTGRSFVYLAYSRESGRPPVTGLAVVSGSSRNTFPDDPVWIRCGQDCNEWSLGHHVYVCYKLS